MNATTTSDPRQKVLTLVIPGDLKSTTLPELQPEIERALSAAADHPETCQLIVVNLVATNLIDSMGLNLLARICRHAQETGARVRVVYANPHVHRTLIFTRLDRHAELVQN